MKKQIKVATLAGVAVLSAAALAQAAPAELNIYGASAQYLFWNAQAKNYAQNVLGCATVTDPVNNAGKHGFVKGTSCTSALVPAEGIEIRYSGVASAEGPLSVAKQSPIDATLATGCNIADGQRLMFASPTTLTCKQVHIGASDVAGETFTQISSGAKQGPLGSTAIFTPVNNPIDTTALGLTPWNTVVVPFGMFVNSNVKATKCSAGLVGNYCTASSQCNTSPTATDGVCNTTPATIDNLSRSEVAMLFSGQVADWSDLGAYFTPQQVVACLRHAGSGTAAAFDYTVMNAGLTGWGAATLSGEDRTGAAGNLIDGGLPKVFFNQASGDLIKCVNGATTATPNGSLIGAVGYADADQKTGVANTSQNVKAIKYNGVWPTRTNIRNGSYEFYTAAWLYTNPANAAENNAIAESMLTFAQLGSSIPADKVNYWAALGEMKYLRGADGAYVGFVGAADPQLP